MNFDLTDEQVVGRDLAEQVFAGHASAERVREVERDHDGCDARLWRELAKSQLLGLCLPGDVGGSGLGMVELCLLLEQQGRRVAPVPLWSTVALGALAVAAFGTHEQRATWLPGVASGDVIMTAALSEIGADDAMRSSVTASPVAGGWRLCGFKPAVSAAQFAHCILVPARHDDGAVSVFLVDPAATHVEVQPAAGTSHQPLAHVQIDAVVSPAARLGGDAGDGRHQLEFILQHTLVGLCALQVGVCSAATEQTASYTSSRHQFGKPLSTFQGVAHQAADAFILTEAMRVTMLQAAWRLAQGLPAHEAVLIAKYWASEGGQKVVHLCQHLHGGIGSDVEYPIHRYFLWSVQNETTLGAGSVQLARLGALIAGERR